MKAIPESDRRRVPRLLVVSVLAMLLLFVLQAPVAFVRIAVATVFGATLGAINSTGLFGSVLSVLPVDPVYGSIAAEMVSGLKVRGIAIAGPLGESLHATLPAIFASPLALRSGDWLGGVVAPGGPITARFITLLLAEMSLLAAGMALADRCSTAGATGPGRRLLRWLGIIVQATALGSLLALMLIPPDYERMGLAPVINKLLGARSMAEYRPIAATLLPIVQIGVPLVAIVSTFGFVELARSTARAIAGRSAPSAVSHVSGPPVTPAALATAFALGMVQVGFIWTGSVARAEIVSDRVALAAAPEVRLAPVAEPAPARETNTGYLDTPIDAMAESSSLQAVSLGAAGGQYDGWSAPGGPASVVPVAATVAELQATPPPQVAPTVVRVEGGNYQYQLLVNGQPRVVKGLGYNAQYAKLPPVERRRLYQRDFAQIRRAGIEVVQGWDPQEFDELLIDVAQATGLGVVMPFDLPVDGDYQNPDYRQQLKAEVEQWVLKYREQPALWMWGLGNEVLHSIKSRQQARAFATFYVEVADLVNSLDSNHPVFYRDAEDVFVAPMRDAFAARPAERPWLIYGVNIFTDRIETVINGWQRLRFDVPIILSEFGPMGYPPADRPDGYRWRWSLIRSKPELILGGFVYVWFRDGPDPLDPMFGLVDNDGLPTDGSLEAIAEMYRETQ